MTRTYLPGSIYRGEDRTSHWVERILPSGKRERFTGSRADVEAKALAWRTERHVVKQTPGWPQ